MKINTKKKKTGLILLMAFFLFPHFLLATEVSKLRCEYIETPIGIDTQTPRLSWLMLDNRNGAAQSAYRLTISIDSSQLLNRKAFFWDSGKINSDKSLVTYSGKALSPFTKYYWSVEVWDEKGKAVKTKISFFETGMMGMQNWQGSWISDRKDINYLPAPYFRKTFEANKNIVSAHAYIAVAGLYELYINGKKIGDHRLDPMYTRFDRRNLYVSYDVTRNLQAGKNAIGVLLGNGWYNMQSLAVWNFDRAPWRARPTFCFDLRITYSDGSTEVQKSDLDWKTSPGSITSNSIYTAEHYDARLEQKGWNTADFDDSKWNGVKYRAAPAEHIASQIMHPIKNVQEIETKSMQKFSEKNYVFDLGRNIAGVSKITVEGDSGTVIRLRHTERILKNGHTDMSNIDVYYHPKDDADPFQTDIFTLSGNGLETFMPKFNYKGFQYIEVTSSKPIELKKESLVGYFMHSDVPVAGKLSSSNPLLGKIWLATNNSYLSNLFGYPTDCPQREKNGWTGDGHFAVETGLYNFDGITIYEKWMADHRDEQQPNGVLPDIIPTGGWGYGTANGTDWTSTIALIPWNLYLFYGDSKSLEDCYGNIKSYVDYVTRGSREGLTSFGRGDWVPVKSTSSLEYTSSIYFYVDATILYKAAVLFNKKDDEIYYKNLADKIKKAINDKYLNRTTGIYSSGVQTELSMALHWGIVPEELIDKVADNLAIRVKADGMHLDVGVLGAKAILNALSDHGHADIAYQLALQDTYPSWGWWIVNGATTLYENWDLDAKRDVSENHMMFGEIGAWFFKGLGGIKIDESKPGFKNILLKPNFVSGLDRFESEHESPFGVIKSAWKKEKQSITFDFTIPSNSSATVYLPIVKGLSPYLNKNKLSTKIQLESGIYQIKYK